MIHPARLRILRLRAGLRGEVLVIGIRDTPAALRQLAHQLTPRERHAARALRLPARRRSFLLGCALLRIALAARTGRAPRRVRLQLRRNRRPLHRPGNSGALGLSVSHAGGWVFAAVRRGAATGLRVGVDIERSDRQLSPSLDRKLPWRRAGDAATAPTAASIRQRIRSWTLIEAALKADGRGLPGLPALTATAPPHDGALVLHVALPPEHRILAHRLSGLPPGLVGAVALARPERARPERAPPERAPPERAPPERARPERARPARARPTRARPTRARPV